MPEIVYSLLVRPTASIKRNYSFRMISWKRSLEIRSCIEILWRMITKRTELISKCSTVDKELHGLHTGSYTVDILHPSARLNSMHD